MRASLPARRRPPGAVSYTHLDVYKRQPQREAELAPVHRDRFFDLVMDRMIEVQLPGGTRTRLWVERRDPRMQLTARRYGRDGIKISFDGVLDGEEPRRIAAGFGGEQHLYLAQEMCIRDRM